MFFALISDPCRAPTAALLVLVGCLVSPFFSFARGVVSRIVARPVLCRGESFAGSEAQPKNRSQWDATSLMLLYCLLDGLATAVR